MSPKYEYSQYILQYYYLVPSKTKSCLCVLKGISSTLENQTVELERELEKVKCKKTNLGNMLFILPQVDCNLSDFKVLCSVCNSDLINSNCF